MVLNGISFKCILLVVFVNCVSVAFSQTESSFVQTEDRQLFSTDVDSLVARAKAVLKKGKYRQADSLYVKALAQAEKVSSEESPEYVSILCDYLSLCLENDKLAGLKEKFEMALRVRKETFGEASLEYAEPLNHYGRYLMQIADYDNAEKALLQTYGIRKELMKETPAVYIETLLSLGMLYLCKQDYVEADRYCREALELSQNTNDELNVGMSKVLLATYCAHTGEITKSLNLFPEALRILKKCQGEEHPAYMATLTTYASVLVVCGSYQKAERLTVESLRLSEKVLGKENIQYFTALSSLASLYNQQYKFEEAEKMLLESIELCRKLYGETNTGIAPLLIRLASVYQNLANYEKVEQISRQVLDIISLTPDALKALKATALATLGEAYIKQKRFDDALEVFRQAMEEQRANNLSNDHLSLTIAIGICSILLQDKSKEPAFIERELKKIIGFSKEHYSEQSIQYLVALNHLASLYVSESQYDRALAIYEEVIKGFQDGGITVSWHYVDIIWSYALTLYMTQRSEESLLWHKKCLEITKELATRDFLFLSEAEQEKYWKGQNYRLKHFLDIAARGYLEGGDKRFVAFAYDCELFAKNLLLTSTVDRQKAIFESGNRELVNMWRMVKSLRDASRNEEAYELERRLVDELKKEGMSDEFSSDWQSIRRMLAPGEAAVEIINCLMEVDKDKPEVYYFALVIRADSEFPEMAVLGDEGSIRTILAASEEAISPLYNLLWEPVVPYLSNMTTIYIAPSGLFNTISFSVFKNPDDGHYIPARYTVHNLLSTRDIASLKAKNETKSYKKDIILFGGADFGLSPKMLDDSDNVTDVDTEAQSLLVRGTVDHLLIRRGQGFDFLPGSQEEVLAIEKITSAAKWKVSLFTDTKATETRLKSYSGNSPEVLHISTHGFYFSPPDKGLLPDVLQLQDNSFSRAVEPMMRSGLLLSGANNIWTGKTSADMSNDGVLTAYEIANLDFSNTELVVLSACDTGLGDIDYSEGIYGLQRAFRLAGVRSMIISLWKVPDEETTTLMIAFYTAWTSGLSMKQAFEKAQQDLRNRYPVEPHKWGGFVLVE